MPKTPAPPTFEGGRFVDSESGLLIPRSYANRAATEVFRRLDSTISAQGFSQGTAFERDSETLAVRWPLKGSGYDDQASQAIVEGNVSNVGVAPVVAPQISGMVRRQQNQAATASLDLTGRTYPTKLARDAIARFNDSPLGITQALQQIVYGLCTYNRGAPIASVPITYDLTTWDEYGLTAVPLQADDEKGEPDHFYLEVDWAKHGTPVPFLPSIFDLEPSGIANWPYWYRTKLDDRAVWVLLHHTHIIELTPGTTSLPGIGTSAVWMCLGYLAEQILIIEERAEKMLYSMTDGITILGGVESLNGEQIKETVKTARAESKAAGFLASKGYTLLTSPNANAVSAVTVSFRQPPGMQFKEWREYAEDIIAFCFNEALSALVIRGGVGYGAQSDTAADNSAEGGVGAILYRTALALGSLYPRVQVSVSRQNDRAQRLNIQTLNTFAQAAVPLVTAGILSTEQAQGIIDRDIIVLPQTGVGTVVTSANADESEDEVSDATGSTAQSGQTAESPLAARRSFATLYDDDEVEIDDDDVDAALEDARTIGDDLYGLLTAQPVEA